MTGDTLTTGLWVRVKPRSGHGNWWRMVIREISADGRFVRVAKWTWATKDRWEAVENVRTLKEMP